MNNSTTFPAIATPSPQAEAPFPAWPVFAEDEVHAAARVLRSGKVNYWTGDAGREFEREFALAVGVPYSIAVANGTLALELALRALGIGPGDDVVTTSRTFIASASCIVAAGARPVFADVDRASGNVTAETLARAITPATRAIIVVHLAGWPCDMPGILAFAQQHNLLVIEDCAQAHGASINAQSIGSFGDVAAFSFCQDKILTTAGEGGMVVTKSEQLWRAMWEYKDHGKAYDAVYDREHAPGFRWLHESFGSNYRLSEVQSAVGRVQLSKLEEWVATRRRHAAQLRQSLLDLPALRVPAPADGVRHSYYKFYAYIRPQALAAGWTRDRILAEISALGVPCFSGSCSEIYLEKAFPAELRPPSRLPAARELGETSLMFLVHPTLTSTHIARTAAAIRTVITRATR